MTNKNCAAKCEISAAANTKKQETENNVPLYHFKQGTNYYAYDYLGAHKTEEGIVFRVWAPHADDVSLVGDFNGWDGTKNPMTFNEGIWETTLVCDDFKLYSKYKYLITRGKSAKYKADPYAFFSEIAAPAASIFYDIEGYKWHDDAFLKERALDARYLSAYQALPKPINVYEVHLGSWKRNEDGSYMGYRQLADELSAYVKMMGYTHVELMPVAEHPYDGSWGYQICGYYAPTSRFGTPHDFMYFVDKLHSVGIGVIVDWVPAHFPKDEHGLYEFDGAPLYEYQGKDRMENRSWGTRAFDVARNEVQSFLISNALFWFRKYHIDALRIDAVASMLYLDYDRKPGEWFPNPDGSNYNLESIAFFKKLNSVVRSTFPDVMMIAEESTDYDGVTKPEGLGFSMKWNMGWMNDTLDYVQTDGFFRKYKHNKMTFSMMYAFKENYILPISHDEVVHGKKSFIDKMFGEYNEKFACARAYLCYMFAHPGKKLTFMGNEFGQFAEWNFEKSLEWFMLDFEMHEKLRKFNVALNYLYLSQPPLWENDSAWEGFAWIFADNAQDNIYAFKRYDKSGNALYAVLNFSGSMRDKYKIPVERSSWYTIILNSDEASYGGSGVPLKKSYRSKKCSYGYEIELTLPALSGIYFIEKPKTIKPEIK